MKSILLFLLVLPYLPAGAFTSDTLYYDIHWNLCVPHRALFYRVTTVEKDEILFNGPVRDYMIGTNRLVMEGRYEMGSKSGQFTFYYLNGQTESSGLYADNKRTGKWETYHENGKLHKLTEYTNSNSYLLHALWDSLGNQLVNEGNGVWTETNRNADNNRLILVEGKVEKGLRDGKWRVLYTNGEMLLEEHYVKGKFNFGDLWDKGKKIPYYESRLKTDEYAELSKPELFAYDQQLMDKNYYGEGLYYFLHTFLKKPYLTTHDMEHNNVYALDKASVNCDQEKFLSAAYPGGPISLYRYINSWKTKTADPDDKSGMMLINLRINKYGLVRDYYLSKGINMSQNSKAIDRVKNMKWIPASCNSININSYKRIAIFY
jgi:antitoxin component YwqK of YwqJK toxin-antitoxin module